MLQAARELKDENKVKIDFGSRLDEIVVEIDENKNDKQLNDLNFSGFKSDKPEEKKTCTIPDLNMIMKQVQINYKRQNKAIPYFEGKQKAIFLNVHKKYEEALRVNLFSMSINDTVQPNKGNTKNFVKIGEFLFGSTALRTTNIKSSVFEVCKFS